MTTKLSDVSNKRVRAPGTVHSGGTDEGAIILSVCAAWSDADK